MPPTTPSTRLIREFCLVMNASPLAPGSLFKIPYWRHESSEPTLNRAAERPRSAAGAELPLACDWATEPHTTAVPPSAAAC
jgi:hypothetical protein